MARVVVVGGGLAGCTAALRLAEAGLAVTLVEKRQVLGGRASSYRAAGWEHPVDNAQHVLMGCCTHQIDLYQRLGVADQITWHDRIPLVAADGTRGIFSTCRLPEPLHLLPGLLGLPGLSPVDRALLAAAFGRMMLTGAPPEVGFADWLGRLTTPALDRGFWRLMIASVLNSPPGEVGAEAALFFFRHGLMRHRDGFRLGVPRVPLSALHDEAMARALERLGVDRRRGAGRLAARRGRLAVRAGDDELPADAVVVAVHQRQLAGTLPTGWARRLVGDAPDVLGAAPLCGVHLGYDEPVLDEPVVGFLGADIDWLMTFAGGRHLSLCISAAETWRGLSHAERVARGLAALRRYQPHLPEPRRAASCLESRATLVPGPGVDRWRPGPTTAVPWLYLAGCWTDTGWPSTMEGAIRSGRAAADAVLRDLGIETPATPPDLPPGGLMRWVRC